MRRKLYLNFILVLSLLLSASSYAQLNITSNDTVVCSGASLTLNSTQQTRNPIPVIFIPNPTIDDRYSGVIPIGFSFTFYGTAYTSCVISSNGYITFNTGNANGFSQFTITSGIPSNPNTLNSILGVYADWATQNGGSVDYAVVGTAPSRKFVVTFCGTPMFGSACGSLIGTSQIVLHETTNLIDIHVGRKPDCPTWNSGASIEGLHLNSTTAHVVPDPTYFFRNYPFPWIVYHSSHRFTPLTATSYSLSIIPYKPIPTSATYTWYRNNTIALGSTPSITINPTASAFYTVRKIECTDTLSDTVVVNILNSSTPTYSFNNPTTCGGSNGNITLNGLASSASYTINYSLNSIPQPGLTISSNSTGSLIIPNLVAGSYSLTAGNGICSTPTIGPINLLGPAPSIVASSNTPVCQGDTIKLFGSTVSGATYSWSGPSFTSNNQNPILLNAQTANGGSYTVTATAPNCSPASSSITIAVNPRPVIGSVSSANPVTCGGTSGTITLSGLSSNTSYSVNYLKNSIPQGPITISSNSTGDLTISGLTAGTYSAITVDKNGCISLPAGPVTLSDPALPATPAITTNSPVCEGGTISLNTASVTSATYTWTGPSTFGSSLQNPTITNAQLVNGGNYWLTITVNNCTSAAGTATVIVNPTPVVGSINATNPTTCLGSNGAIIISGLNNSTSYSVSYSKNGLPQPSTNITSNGAGTLTITGLTAGIYSNIVITLSGCNSAPAGPVTLTDPPIPAAPTASNNGPVCQGTTISLSASGVAGGSYTWTGPSFSSAVQNPTINNAQLSNSGTYSVTVTVNNCTSIAASTTVTVNPLPVISGTSFINPTTCGGTNGSITLNGLTNNTTYAISYLKNAVPQGPVNLLSSSTGSVIISGLSAGIYSGIFVTLNGCNSLPTVPINLTDPNSPATPTITSNSPVCQGGTISLSTAAVSSATYNWTGPSFSSAQQNPNITNAQLVNAGNYTLTVTVNGCTSAPGSASVVVNSTPLISGLTSTNPTTCGGSNGAITINGTANNTTYSINYTKNSIAQPSLSIQSSGTGTIVITGLSSATYANFIITANGCNSLPAGPITLSDPPTPVAPVASNNGPICQGSALTLSATTATGGSYSWTGPSFSSSQQNPTIPNAQTSNSGVYSVTVTVNNCTSTAGTTTATINPIPTTTAGSNSPVCEGKTLNLTATNYPGASYSWTGPSYTSNTQNPAITNVTTGASGTYTVTASLNGCSSTSNTTVSIISTPAAPIVSNVTYCQLDPAATLTATGQNLLWYTLPSGGVGNTTAPTPSTVNAGTFTWYVSQSIGGCESPRSVISVNIIAKPQPPIAVSTITYCQFSSALSLTANGQNLKWYNSLTGGTGTSAAPTPSTSTPGTTTWFVSQTINGCESNRASIVVTINQKPGTPVVSSPVLYCKDDPVGQLVAQGQNLLWYTSSTGGSGAGNAPTPSTSTIGSQFFYVTQTVQGCESERAIIEVLVNDKRDINITLDKYSVCQYDTITASAVGTNPPGTTYTWNFSGGTVISGIGIGPYLVRWNSDGIKTITVTSNEASCSARDTAKLTVSHSPDASFVLQQDACLDEMISVQAAWGNLSHSAYTWNFDGATVLGGSGPGAYKLKWNQVGPKLVSLMTLENGCPSEKFIDTITIHPDPVVKIETEKTNNICSGDLIKVSAIGNNSSNTYSYLWTPKEYFTYAAQQNTIATVKATGLIYLHVEDAYGCKGSDSIYIATKPCCDAFLPDAFTPNGDGKNDYFHIISMGHHKLTEFRVVNRWGQAVFEGGDIKAGWDGTFGGQPQPVGTYFYYLRYQCGTGEVIEKKGELTLIR